MAEGAKRYAVGCSDHYAAQPYRANQRGKARPPFTNLQSRGSGFLQMRATPPVELQTCVGFNAQHKLLFPN
jgi:hypothetical protein